MMWAEDGKLHSQLEWPKARTFRELNFRGFVTQCLLVRQPNVAYFYYWSSTSVRVRFWVRIYSCSFGVSVRVRFWVRI